MAIKIANVLFDSQQRRLEKGNQSRSLEPKVFSLLRCLLAANGQIVTRDQLLVDVWDKRIVGEGAINRTVSMLRAHFLALTDEEIIETVPTQGYRLIACVSEYFEAEPIQSSNSTPNEINNSSDNKQKLLKLNIKKNSLIFSILLTLMVTFAFFLQQENIAHKNQLSLINDPLIALDGWEYQISATSAGTQILFHHLDDNNQQSVFLYDTVNHKKEKIFTDSLATISPNGERIIYVNLEDKQCEFASYHLATKHKQTLFSCNEPPTSLIWGKNDTIYFNKRFSKSHPYQIFSYDIKTSHLVQLSNPSSINNTRGDFRFAYNNDTERLAAIRYVNENKSTIIVYQGEKILTEQTINKRIHNLVWHPNKKDLVIADNNNLYRFTTNNGQYQLLQQLSFRINSLAVIPYKNNSSLLVSSTNATSEIIKTDLKSGIDNVWQTSARAELLPRMQGDSEVILSTRYQKHHLWKITNGEAALIDVKLPFDLQFVRYELSTDGKRVLFSKHGAIFELDLEQNSYDKLFGEPTNSYVANYDSRDDDDIIYSSNHSGQWQLWSYQRYTNTHNQLTTNGGYSGRILGQYLYYSKYAVDGLWRKSLTNQTEVLVIEDFSRINWLNWQIINNQLYFYRAATGIWQFDINSDNERLIMEKSDDFIHQYTLSPDQQFLYWVRLNPVRGDIYQYQF